MARLEGKVAVVTGGTSGIGRAIVEHFVAEGARVLFVGLGGEGGAELAKSLGDGALYKEADVSQEADVAGMIAGAVDSFGRLDCLVNNAGVPGPYNRVAETKMEDFDRVMAVLVRGTFLGIKYAAPIMIEAGGGSIINTASVAGRLAGYGPHPYSAAKAAVIHLTRSTATELAPHHIRVNSISPGFIVTPIFGRAFGLDFDAAQGSTTELADEAALHAAIPRAGQPEDIARAAVFLASDESEFIAGHDLVVDGGLTAGRGWREAIDTIERLGGALGVGR